jgi:RNA polymerase sigma factor (sigma-70 family)
VLVARPRTARVANLSAWRIWLLSIARNRVRDAGRMLGRTKRGGDHHIDRSPPWPQRESVSSLLPPGSTTPSRVAGFRERARAMELALDSLEPDLRSVVHLRLFEEVPMRDVAEQLGTAAVDREGAAAARRAALPASPAPTARQRGRTGGMP